jgi:DNA-binding protein HU-beta
LEKEEESMAGKADFINSIVDAVDGLTKRQATTAFEAVFDAITQALKSGESAKVPGFGSFTVSERAARKGRNPATGQSINIKASKSVRFKAGKELKESVNKKRRKS